jgi:hypothetical protein
MQARLDLSDVSISLGNNGLILHIKDNAGNHVGKLRIGQATAEWCRGRTRMGNGKRIPLGSLVTKLEEM